MPDDNDRHRTVDLGDDSLTGSDLRSLCREPGGALRLVGGRVDDTFDLVDLHLERRLEFHHTVFTETVQLSSLRCRGLSFTGCQLRAGLHAPAANIEGNLRFDDCVLTGSSPGSASSRPSAIWLTDAVIAGRLSFSSTIIGSESDDWSRAVHADRVKVGAGLVLGDGTDARGEIKMTGAVVGGSMQLYGCRIHDPYVGLYLSEADIRGNLSIMDDRSGRTSRIDGGLVLSGCSVAGQFLVYAAEIRAPAQADNPRYKFRGAQSGVAIDATRARFDGDVRLYGGSTVVGQISLATATVESQLDLGDTAVEAPEAGWSSSHYPVELSNATLGSDLRFHGRTGSIRLENAKVAGSIHFEDLVVTANQDEGVEARNVRVDGDVWLDRAVVVGGDTDFRLSHVAGDWRAPEARLDSTGATADYALTLTSSQIDGSVFLNRGFDATGLVRLSRSRIGGRLNFDGSTIRSAAHAPSPLVVACRSTVVASSMFLDWEVDGTVDFQSTQTDLLVDHPANWGAGHVIRGLVYQRLGGSVGDQASTGNQEMADDVDLRLKWLAGQSEPDAGTYSQLADYYRRHGRTVEAEQVLMARNRFLRSERRSLGGWRNRVKNVADLVWDLSVGYGYRASRAALVIVALVALTGVVLGSQFARDRMVTTDENNVVFTAADPCDSGTVRCYNPLFYAIDTVVPLIDLQQRSTWYVARSRSHAVSLEWALNITVLLGWAASSALVLGLTRTLTPEP